MSQPKHHPAPGSLVGGKYRVERVLGEGGMAVVFEATHLQLGQRVAIKVLVGESAQATEVLERFKREAQIAAQLPGDHIARVTDLGLTAAGDPFLVMELLVGRDLEAELQVVGRLPVDVAVDYILQACEGVAEAHAAGLVHRDLKPGNLFLIRRRDGSPVIKVLDFGISKAAPGQGDQALTKTATNFGTPLYMSPEQIQSAKHVDARSDQHALAAILYAMVTGRPPFDAESLTALAVVIATQAPTPARALRRDVPAGLDAALGRALSKRPIDRFPDLASFAAAIAPFGTASAQASVRTIAHALAYPDPSTDPGQRRILESLPPQTSGPGPFARVAYTPSGPHAPSALSSFGPARTHDIEHTPSMRISGPSGDFEAPSTSLLAAQTSAALSTAIPIGGATAARRRALLAAVATVGLLGTVTMVALLAINTHPTVPEAAPAAEAHANRDTAASAPVSAADPGVTPGIAAPEPTASVTPPAPSVTATASAAAKPRAPRPPAPVPKQPPPKPKEKDPTEVFGARRR
jgi:serine/threonine-protein kinase